LLYSDFQNEKLSRLGMGAMRLPVVDGTQNIDEAALSEMVDYALKHGVNYFDTAWPYHQGTSEIVLGRVLSKYPRDSYYLANKFPGHMVVSTCEPAVTFEKQLKKCGVEYFDFYLLHNVCEYTLSTYTNPDWDILNYFLEQKRLGRIRHLGFSTHASLEGLKTILDLMGEHMEFCQIQLNYLDSTLQNAKAKYELLTERGIPVVVMEPVRGGKLASLSEGDMQKLRAFRPEAQAAEWALRWVQDLPNVMVVLSGMSNMDQLTQNVATFQEHQPLSTAEKIVLAGIAEGMKNAIPCTACRYCVEGCPIGLDIPRLLSLYNEFRFAPAVSSTMQIDALPADKRPSACIACGSCSRICPQGIDIPKELAAFTEGMSKQTSWAEICIQREAIAKKLES